jgi:hypothetical protein
LVGADRQRTEKTYRQLHRVATSSAGQIWRRPDGLRWVEIQAEAMEPSGWRLMFPLVDLDDAPHAPPLVVTLDDVRARVHLLSSVPDGDLGEPTGFAPRMWDVSRRRLTA